MLVNAPKSIEKLYSIGWYLAVQFPPRSQRKECQQEAIDIVQRLLFKLQRELHYYPNLAA